MSQVQSQARVDERTPLGSMIDHVWIPGIGGLQVPDRKGHADLFNVQGTPGRTTKPRGIHYSDSDTGCVYGTLAPLVYPFFVVIAGYFGSGANGWCLASFWPSSLAATSSRGDILLVSGTTMSYNFRSNFGTTATVTSGTLTGLSSSLPICVVVQSVSNADHRLYVNGTKTTSTTDMGTMAASIDRFAIGRAGTGGSAPASTQLVGGVLFAGIGSTALPDDMALALSADHRIFWQMFPSPRRLFTSAPAGGSVKSRYYYDMGMPNSV